MFLYYYYSNTMAGVMPIPPATRTRDLYLKKKNPNTNCGQMRARKQIIDQGHDGMTIVEICTYLR